MKYHLWFQKSLDKLCNENSNAIQFSCKDVETKKNYINAKLKINPDITSKR